jgi:hypothetical protein
MRLTFKAIILFLVLAISGFTELKRLDIVANYFATDELNNIYTVVKGKVLKYNKEGVLLNEYNQKKLGKPNLIDVSQPLNVMLVYSNYATVEILDRNMILKNEINFQKYGIKNMKVVCMSPSKNIWLYDQTDMKLKEFDFSLNKVHETEDLSLLLNAVPNPVFAICSSNNLYVTDPSKGIFVFDLIGAYKKQYFLKGIRQFQIIQNQLIFYKNKQLHSFNLQNFEENIFSIPDSSEVKSARIETERLYLLRKNGLTLYSF